MNRRTVLQTIGLGATATLVGTHFTHDAAATTATSETNWSRPWGTTGRTRYNQSHESTDSYGQTDWKGGSGHLTGTPTVSDGVLYTSIVRGYVSYSGYIRAYDLETGSLLWSVHEHKLTEEEKERIAEGSDPLINESSAPYGYLTHSPVIEDGVLYGCGSSSGDAQHYVADGVYALDAKTGEELWARTDLVDYSELEISNGLVYLSGLTLDAKTGEIVWDTSADEEVIGIVDETLYTYAIVSRPDEDVVMVIARDAQGGTRRWRALSPYGTEGLPKAVDEDFIYLVSPEEVDEEGIEPRVCALSTSDGHVEWETTLSVRDGTIDVSAPAVDDTSVYLLTTGTTNSFMVMQNIDAPIEGVGTAVALDRETGAEQWRLETPAAFVGDPAVDANSLYATARYHACPESPSQWVAPGLYTIDKQTGVKQWTHTINGLATVFSPAVADDRVLLAARDEGAGWGDGKIYSFSSCGCAPECNTQFADDGRTRTIPQPPEEQQTTTTTSSPETTEQDRTTTTSPTTTNKETTTADSATTDRASTLNPTTTGQQRQTSTSITSSVSEKTSPQTTTSDGQPGFGILGAIGSLIGGTIYALRQLPGNK